MACASPSVFIYGRGTENRTRIYWLKASYSSRWVIPPNWWWQLDSSQRPVPYEGTALPLCYVTISKHTWLPLQPCSCQFRMKLDGPSGSPWLFVSVNSDWKCVCLWQGIQESNLCQRSQSPLCYHYTNPQHKKYGCKLLKNVLLTLYRLNTCSITQSGRLSTTIFIDVVFIQHKEKPPRVCYLSRGLVFVFSFGLFWSSGITSPHLRCVAVGFLKARNILPRTWHIISCCWEFCYC